MSLTVKQPQSQQKLAEPMLTEYDKFRKRQNNLYNGYFYSWFNVWYIYEFRHEPEMSEKLVKVLIAAQKSNKLPSPSSEVSLFEYDRTVYEFPPYGTEFSLETDKYGIINITCLSDNGMNFSGFRVSQATWSCKSHLPQLDAFILALQNQK